MKIMMADTDGTSTLSVLRNAKIDPIQIVEGAQRDSVPDEGHALLPPAIARRNQPVTFLIVCDPVAGLPGVLI